MARTRIAIVAALLVSALAGCADGTASTSVASGPRATWDEQGSDSYTLTIERMCFCPNPGPYVVTVDGGEVISVTNGGHDVPLDDPTLETWPLTVDELFAEVEDAEATADDVAVTYDPDLGYPRRIFIDRWQNAIDDELTWVAKGLELA